MRLTQTSKKYIEIVVNFVNGSKSVKPATIVIPDNTSMTSNVFWRTIKADPGSVCKWKN